MGLNIVLFEPEIPQNTGNIARTCACTGAKLHLVEPMGFRLSSKQLGRASMDYWDKVDITRWACVEAFMEAHGEDELHLFTGRTSRSYYEESYGEEAFLVFGRESKGIDPQVLEANEHRCVRIPMDPSMRSLNLSNSVAIAAYEWLRRQGFPGLC